MPFRLSFPPASIWFPQSSSKPETSAKTSSKSEMKSSGKSATAMKSSSKTSKKSESSSTKTVIMSALERYQSIMGTSCPVLEEIKDLCDDQLCADRCDVTSFETECNT